MVSKFELNNYIRYGRDRTNKTIRTLWNEINKYKKQKFETESTLKT